MRCNGVRQLAGPVHRDATPPAGTSNLSNSEVRHSQRSLRVERRPASRPVRAENAVRENSVSEQVFRASSDSEFVGLRLQVSACCKTFRDSSSATMRQFVPCQFVRTFRAEATSGMFPFRGCEQNLRITGRRIVSGNRIPKQMHQCLIGGCRFDTCNAFGSFDRFNQVLQRQDAKCNT